MTPVTDAAGGYLGEPALDRQKIEEAQLSPASVLAKLPLVQNE